LKTWPIHLTSTKDSLKILSLASQRHGGNERRAHRFRSIYRAPHGRNGNSTVSVDLRLLSGYMTNVDVNGHADIKHVIRGIPGPPRIIGR